MAVSDLRVEKKELEQSIENLKKEMQKLEDQRTKNINENQNGVSSNISITLNLPNVHLIGSAKGGSTSLAWWLFEHDGVCPALKQKEDGRLRPKKELEFFYNKKFFEERPVQTIHFEQGRQYYADFYKHCSNENNHTSSIIFDGTPHYILYASNIRRFYDLHDKMMTPKLKFILTIREPVSRELSLYNQRKKWYQDNPEERSNPEAWYNIERQNGTPLSTFEEYVMEHLVPCLKQDYTKKTSKKSCNPFFQRESLYASPIQEWFTLFDRSQILVLSYDELKRDPDSVVSRIQNFLREDYPNVRLDPSKLQHKNALDRPDKTKLPSCKAQRELNAMYQPWNEKLYELLESNPGHDAEQRPFPRFQLGECVDNE